MTDPAAKPSRRPAVVTFAAAALLVLLMAWPTLGGRIYTSFDFEQFFIPSRAYYSLCLERGELGLWSPFQCRGFEHHAEGQTGIFSPWHWLLYRFLPFTTGFSLELFLYFPLSIVGAWLLLRKQWRLSPLASAFGASLYSLSALAYAHFGHVHNQWQMAHLPWLAWFACRCYRRHSAAFSAAVLGLGYASVILLGHPQFTWLVSLAIGLLILYQTAVTMPRRDAVRGFAFAMAGVVTGVLIGLVQLIPTVDALRMVARGNLNPLERLNYSLHPLNLLENLSPYTFADHTAGDTFYHSASEHMYLNNPSEFTAYAGIALLTLLAAGLVLYRRRLGRAQAIAIGAGIGLFGLLSLGKYGGLHNLLGAVPLLAEVRCPARYFVLVMALLVLAGALVLHALDTSPPEPLSRRQLGWLFAVPAVSLLGCLVLLAAGPIHFRGQTLATGGIKLLAGPLLAAAVAGGVVLVARGRRWALGGIALVCLLDAGLYGLPLVLGQPTRPAAEVAEVRANMRDQDHSFHRIATDTRPLWEGWYLANGYMAIQPAETLPLTTREGMRVAAVSHGLVDGRWLPLPSPLPRFRLVPRLELADDPLAALDGSDPDAVAYLRPADHPGQAAFDGPPLAIDETIAVDDDGYDRLVLTVHVRHPRLLVIADRWAPGWQVDAPGYAPDAVLPLYGGAVRGLVVSPNHPKVALVYRPASFRQGLACARAGLILAALLLIGGLVAHSRRKTPLAEPADPGVSSTP